MTERTNLETAAYNLARAELAERPFAEPERETIASAFAEIYTGGMGDGFRMGIQALADDMGLSPAELMDGSMRAVWTAFAAGSAVSSQIREQRASQPPGRCHYCGRTTTGDCGGWWLCARDECLDAFDADLDHDLVSPGAVPQSEPHPPVEEPENSHRYQIRLRAALEWACKEIRKHNASASYVTPDVALGPYEKLAERP